MSSFITNLFPSSQSGKHDGILPVPPPPLHTRSSQNEAFSQRPGSPTRNSFITPISTPQGSPSKDRNPPGANDLQVAFENTMKLTPTTFGSPPSSRGAESVAQNQAAISRQELYQPREQPPPTVRKYNTQRGLTAEELEILHKPNVKRLANVTQLCRLLWPGLGPLLIDVL